MEWTQRKPTDGSPRWSSYSLAKHLGLDQSTVAKAWKKFKIKPQIWYSEIPVTSKDKRHRQRYGQIKVERRKASRKTTTFALGQQDSSPI